MPHGRAERTTSMRREAAQPDQLNQPCEGHSPCGLLLASLIAATFPTVLAAGQNNTPKPRSESGC
eukprot:2894809-Alexandrium_andersonii.AAC.1